MLVSPGSLLGAPELPSTPIAGISQGGNAVITLSPPKGITVSDIPRVYFKSEGTQTEYFVEMLKGADGNYAALLPAPLAETTLVQYRIAVKGANGAEISTAPYTVPVVANASEVKLTEEQKLAAKNLVIGQTDPNAEPLPPGFECEGIVKILTTTGELKAVECSRKKGVPVLLWVAGGAILAGGGVYLLTRSGSDKPVSPSRPEGTTSKN